ncbi:xanthine dehydrogenase family protein molybdopterin-binding subunit [Polyangium aurulentum]|uniref:xanthine dehydrogenase family protein molybdopterin-binding subunit n=1 Tax=Polyangium aurulentum TaxID=2567896 RepID=UPI0010AE3E25|nr:xanthine dehydrogenase family protein molybdopterin-binding subunit [Polyangium aurulentum]UQA54693.1 xanthine dehydrogenase family protein molybdopterin-binding subunit [Polyangium aurulentum]
MTTAAPSRPSLVGQSVPRTDGAAKVTGQALYVDDLPRMPGELHGITVRSPVPRGILRGVTLDPAFDWSDVTVVRAEDVPVNIVATIVDDQPILAADRINHAYEPVVLLACADRQKLARAAKAVHLDIEPLPAIIDPVESFAQKEIIWGEDNVHKRYLLKKGRADVEGATESASAIDAALAECEVVVGGRYTTHHQEQLYIEPQGIVAFWDDAGVHATGSLQCPYYVHKAFLRAFGIPPQAIHVTQAVTGGGFGGKEEYPSVIALHAALLAKKSGRPVRMIYDRKEDIEATTKRHPSICEITTGCDADGTLRAIKMRVLMDGGAYVTLTPVVLSRGALHSAGAYRWQDVRIEAIAVATNTPPNGAFRGFGAPQTIWAIERHLDRVARAVGIDPVELKRKNLLKEGDTTATGQVLRGSVGGASCLETAIAASGYHDKRKRGPVVTGRVARGIGASVFMHGAGFTGSGERYLKGKVALDLLPGGRLLIRTASTDIGQGTETVFRQIAADAAGVPLEAVDFAVPSTTTVPDSGPTVASRTVMVVGSIVENAARQVAERVQKEQAAGGGSFAEAGDRLLGREEKVTVLLQYEPPGWVQWDDERYKGDAYPVYGWACDVAEVEVDLDTFEVKVVDFWSATDVGKAIHPVMCKGQIEGGSLQAIGWALWEEIVWRDGRIMNPRMTNYIIPTSLDAPPFHTDLVEAPYALGPGGGAKGIGELPMDGGAPAIAAAVEHATGLFVGELPLTPERLFSLYQSWQG